MCTKISLVCANMILSTAHTSEGRETSALEYLMRQIQICWVYYCSGIILKNILKNGWNWLHKKIYQTGLIFFLSRVFQQRACTTIVLSIVIEINRDRSRSIQLCGDQILLGHFFLFVVKKEDLESLHQWMRLNESFLYLVSNLSQPSWSRGRLIFCMSVSDDQSSCTNEEKTPMEHM